MTDSLRVLVVDDDFRVGGLHRDVVAQRPGFVALDPVTSAQGARDAVAEHAPDLVLLDVFLPDGDGLSVLAEFDIDAFVVSAASDGASVRRALRHGALAYLVKPFDTRRLADRLDAYLRYRNVLRDDRAADQERIERALRILRPDDTVGQVSRAVTEQLVLGELQTGDVTATSVATAIGVSRATAQRYLAALVAREIVEVTLRYGTTGRPEHRYRLTRQDAV